MSSSSLPPPPPPSSQRELPYNPPGHLQRLIWALTTLPEFLLSAFLHAFVAPPYNLFLYFVSRLPIPVQMPDSFLLPLPTDAILCENGDLGPRCVEIHSMRYWQGHYGIWQDEQGYTGEDSDDTLIVNDSDEEEYGSVLTSESDDEALPPPPGRRNRMWL